MNRHLKKLLDVLTIVDICGEAPQEVYEISDICMDSRKVTPHALFVCIKGYVSDGHKYAKIAYDRGSRVFVVERVLALPQDAYQIVVEDTRLALAQLSCAFYENPAQKMLTIGITGTKGKTTTALFIRHILESAGISTGYIGTNGVIYADHHYATVNSTPESLVLQSHLYDMHQAGVRVVVLEVSSQGLWMHRVGGICFDVCLFTNLAKDHVGQFEHPTIEHYRACKKMLFDNHSHPKTIFVCNQDDPEWTYMVEGKQNKCVTVSTKEQASATYAAYDISSVQSEEGLFVEYRCRMEGKALPFAWHLPLIGQFNVQNALCALAAVHQGLGIPPTKILTSLQQVSVPGRCEVQVFDELPGATFVIDYAHNGVSMAATLDALRAYHPKRLICMFGSVGNRSQARRAELAEAAGSRADFCVVTSDNPGDEDPLEILNEIDKAFPRGSCRRILIPDRTKAVAYVVNHARSGDIILLAGKGHETTQEISGRTVDYNEKMTLIRAVLQRVKSKPLVTHGEG